MSITRKPALIAACCALAAGGGGAAALASSAGAATTDPGSGSGTATVSLTGPAGKTHSRTPAISCTVTDGHYTVAAHSSHAQRSSTETLTVPDYTGPGSYTGTVVIFHRGPAGFSEHHLTVPVTLTSDGGSVTYSKTLSGKRRHKLAGKTITADASWTCSV